MTDIRINQLPTENSPVASDYVAIDGATTRKTTLQKAADSAIPVASQAEAEAGVNNVKRITPLTSKQSIASEVGVTIASKAQGDLADSSLQDADIGTNVQAYSANLTELASVNPGTTGKSLLASETLDAANTVLDPSAQLLRNQGLWLTYHKARGAWHVKAFGSSLTDVGAGNASVDTAALQSAMDSQQIVDITGSNLIVNSPIVVTYAGACIGSSIAAHRGNAVASSRITYTDPALPSVFDIRNANFEASNFSVIGTVSTTTTIQFLFKRPDNSASDIDARLIGVNGDYGGKFFHIYGRGLEIGGCTFANQQICVGDIDWPTLWTPNGTDTDLITTGMRAYHFHGNRSHANLCGIRNIGYNADNCRGIIINGYMGDIGTPNGIFQGVLSWGTISCGESDLNVLTEGTLADIYPGSKHSTIYLGPAGGFKDGTTQRLGRNGLILSATLSKPIKDFKVVGGTIGPTDRQGILLQSTGSGGDVGGDIELTLIGVGIDRAAMGGNGTNYFPIFVNNNLTSADITLSAVTVDETGVTTPPAYVLGGKNTSAVTLRRSSTTKKVNVANWAQGSVTQITTAPT